MSNLNQNAIREKINTSIGLSCLDFRVIAGGSLIVYFGGKDNATDSAQLIMHLEPAWRIEISGKPIIGSFDTLAFDEKSKDEIKQELEQVQILIGSELYEIIFGPTIVDLVIQLSRSIVIRTFAHGMDGENWELRYCDGVRIGMESLTAIKSWSEKPDNKLILVKN